VIILALLLFCCCTSVRKSKSKQADPDHVPTSRHAYDSQSDEADHAAGGGVEMGEVETHETTE